MHNAPFTRHLQYKDIFTTSGNKYYVAKEKVSENYEHTKWPSRLYRVPKTGPLANKL
jgi:hypothetical protein